MRNLQTVTPAKFHGQPPPDAPGSGRRSGDGGHRDHRTVLYFSGHFRPPHSSFPPFLDPLNSFPWSLFADSTPFGSYNENEIGQRLDRVFRLPQRLLDQGNGTNEFLSLGLSIDMWFVNFGHRLVSFPFLGCFGKLPRSRD